MPPTSSPELWPLPELQRARRAIVVVDVVESVRLMQEDESGFIDRWRRFVNEVRTEVLPAHGGRMVKSLGDGMLLEFEQAPQAVAAAFALHQHISPSHSGLPDSATLWLRCGLHVDKVLVDALDIYGNGVNLAARLAALAGPGETVASAALRDQVMAEFDADMEDLGECYLKHLPTPVRAFRIWPTLPPRFALPPRAATSVDMRPVVAVLPFADHDGTASAHALGDVLADQVVVSQRMV